MRTHTVSIRYDTSAASRENAILMADLIRREHEQNGEETSMEVNLVTHTITINVIPEAK